MRWYKYLLLSILLFIFTPIVKANTCSNSEIVKYKELAKNVEITYDYVETDAGVYFKVKMINLMPGIKIKDVYNNLFYDYTGNELELNSYYGQGRSYKFSFYTVDENCYIGSLYDRYITLPYYNYYHNSELCNGIEEFKYCHKWTKGPNSYDEFEKLVNEYKNSLKTQDLSIENKNENGLFDSIIELYLKYYYIFLPIIIIISLIVIWKYNKNQDLF